MVSRTFAEALAFGKTGESAIAQYMMKVCGCSVLPVYDTLGEAYKGPRFYTPRGELVAPDMLVFKDSYAVWIEAKHKHTFSWHLITRRWTTGIDLHHYEDYRTIAQRHPQPVWLLFLHPDASDRERNPKGELAPIGLFGGEIKWLAQRENHRHANWGTHGMVYWAETTLRKIASWQEVAQLGTQGTHHE